MKAPKKKYKVGGTIKSYNPIEDKKGPQYGNSLGDNAHDFLAFNADNVLSTVGAGNVIKKENYRTKAGAETGNQLNYGVQKIGPGIAGGVLNYFIPGSGTLLKTGVKGIEGTTGSDTGLDKNQSATQDKIGGGIDKAGDLFVGTGISKDNKGGIFSKAGNKKTESATTTAPAGIASATSVDQPSVTPNPYAGQQPLNLPNTAIPNEQKLNANPALRNEYDAATTDEQRQAVLSKLSLTMAKGGVLKGKSHAQGGIDIKVKGGSKVEAENNEIILTKGVFENPHLRGIASAINVAAGGKPITVGAENSFAAKGTVIKGGEPNKNPVSNKGQDAIISIRDKNKKDADIKRLETNIDATKKEIELYKRNKLSSKQKQAEINLANFQKQYSQLNPKKEIAKDSSLNALPKQNVGIDAMTSYAPSDIKKSDAAKVDVKSTPEVSKKKGIAGSTASETTSKGLGISTLPHESTLAEDEAQAQNLAAVEKQQSIDNAVPGKVVPAVQETPVTPTPVNNKELVGAKKAGFDWTQGLGAVQTGLGISSLLKDGTAPTYTPNQQLINDADSLRKETDYGFNPLIMSGAKQDIELARRTANREAMNLTGGSAGAQLAFQTAGQQNTNKSYSDLAKESEAFRLQKKQSQFGMDQGVAAEKKYAFDQNLALFDKRQMAGAQLTQSGIGNMIGAQRYQTEQSNIDKRNAITSAPAQGLSSLSDADIEAQYQTLSPLEKKKYGNSKIWYSKLG